MLRKLIKSVNQRAGRFRKAESGVTAIEYAFIAPFFLFLIFSILETGGMLFVEYSLQASVQEAARNIRTGQAQGITMTSAQFKAKICGYAITIPQCTSKLNVYVKNATSFSTLGMPSYLDVGPKDDGSANPTSYDCGNAKQAVGVIATYDWNFVVPNILQVLNRKDTATQHFLGNVKNGKARRLSGVAIFRNEPFPSGTACGA
jgi:Flp pilus assembly protein TadG